MILNKRLFILVFLFVFIVKKVISRKLIKVMRLFVLIFIIFMKFLIRISLFNVKEK